MIFDNTKNSTATDKPKIVLGSTETNGFLNSSSTTDAARIIATIHELSPNKKP